MRKSSPIFQKNFQELVSQIFSEYITEYFGKILTSNNGEHRLTTLIEVRKCRLSRVKIMRRENREIRRALI